MGPRWLPPLLILFVIFFVLSSPETAGPQARSFFGWIGDQAAAAGTFLDGLFGDDDTSTTTPGVTSTVPLSDGGGTDGTGSNDGTGVSGSNDSFNSLPAFRITMSS
jgi:hypothetical protein